MDNRPDNTLKAELERKREKLREIRKAKEKERERIAALAAADNAAKSDSKDAQYDKILTDLGISVTGPGSLSTISTSASSELSLTSIPDTSSLTSTPGYAGKKKPSLTVVSVQQTNIPPKEQVTYNKQTQTAAIEKEEFHYPHWTPTRDFDWWRAKKAHPLDYYDGHYVYDPTLEWDDEFPVLVYDDVPGEDDEASLPPVDASSTPSTYGHRGHSGMPHVEPVKPARTLAEEHLLAENKALEEKVPKELTEEERHKLMMSEPFHRFFDRASRIIERALFADSDIFVDYSGADNEEKEGDDSSGFKITYNREFCDERWSRNRCVTSFDWSTQFPELLVASYTNNEDCPHDPDGVALVWNMRFKKNTPEYIFHCQSPIMSSIFAKFHPNLIIGGTYSGQIVLWDNRSNKRTPVQRSPLSAAAHTHPVYCIKVVGTQNAHNLVSISTDGKLCSWSLDMLSAPQDTLELQKQSKSVAVTCLSFPANDVNNFIIGSEDGAVYTACRHGTQAGIADIFEGHQGPVTGIDAHNAQGSVDFSHLFVTSSFDWTAKLWSLKEKKPLYSFEDYGDYVYDVSWSPIHPALFASVDGTGRLDLWNLNNDTEAPTASVTVDSGPALNRLSWSQTGHEVIAGDDAGKVWIYDVGEQLALPRNDEWARFAHTLQELKNNQADEELETAIPSSMGSLR